MKKKPAFHTVPQEAQEQVNSPVHGARPRAEVAHALSGFLASTYALYQKSLFYHWNVTGPDFSGLHQLFETHYEALHAAGDVVAERIRALGHYAPGTLREFAALSSVEEDAQLPPSGQDMLARLIDSHEVCSGEARAVLEVARRAEDDVTIDLMIGRMAFHDKAAWMLRACLG